MLALLATSAVAGAPQFVGEGIGQRWVDFAGEMYAAGVACTGRDGRHAGTVHVVEAAMPTSAGRAWTGPEGLYRIELGPKYVSERLVMHEVAHAWSHGAPDAVVEGAAELLADCMAVRIGRPDLRRGELGWHRDRVEVVGPLRDWTSDHLYIANHGYAPAYWYTAALAAHVGLPALVPEEPFGSWGGLWARLPGDPDVLALLAFGTEADSDEGFADTDQDGLPKFHEDVLGTDDTVPDSDGDGLPDVLEAVAAPETAVHVRPDAVWQCLGWQGPRDAFVAVDRYGPRRLDVEANDETMRVVRGFGRDLLVWPVGTATRDARCLEGRGAIWLLDAEVPASWREALADSSVGSQQRLVVRLGGPTTWADERGVTLSSAEVRWAVRAKRLDVLLLTAEVLAHTHLMGLVPDEGELNEEINIRIGYGVRHVALAAP